MLNTSKSGKDKNLRMSVGEDVDTSNRAAAIVLSEKNFTVAIPADVMTKAPILNSPAVDYYAE